MPVEVIWDDAERTVIRYVVGEHWSWNEINAAIEDARTLMAEVDAPVSAIVDLTRSRTVPSFSRWRGEGLSACSPPNLKLVVMVGNESLASLYDIFARFLPDKARYARTLDEARALIAGRFSPNPEAAQD